MHVFDPTGALSLKLRAARRRDLRYAALYLVALLIITAMVLWGK